MPSLELLAPEQMLILGARNEATLAALQRLPRPAPDMVPQRISGDAARQLVVEFWINTAKHKKARRRGFTEMVTFGLQQEQSLILRLLYILATGEDTRWDLFLGIHGLSKLLKVVRAVAPCDLKELFGLPQRNAQEIIAVVQSNRDLVATVGRALAEKLEFAYPEELEHTARSLLLVEPTGP